MKLELIHRQDPGIKLIAENEEDASFLTYFTGFYLAGEGKFTDYKREAYIKHGVNSKFDSAVSEMRLYAEWVKR